MLLLNPFRFGSTAWEPSDLSKAVAWWDPHLESSVTVVTTELTAWEDRIGAVSLAKDTNGPEDIDFGEGKMFQFDRSNSERLKVTTTVADPASGSRSYFVVFRATDSTVGTLFGKDGSGSHHLSLKVNKTARTLAMKLTDGSAVTTDVEDTNYRYSDDQVRFALVEFDQPNGTVRIWADNLQGAAVEESIAFSPGAISPTDPFYVGSDDGVTEFLEGSIGDILVFDDVLTTAERVLLEAWVRIKWDLNTFAVDPGLPAVGTVTGHWSTWDAADYTTTSGRFTQVDDLSGNANHMVSGQPTTAAGPIDVAIDGRQWMDFTGTELLGVTNTDTDPGVDDITCVVVFIARGAANMGLTGKIDGGNPHYQLNIAQANSRNLYMQLQDTGVTPSNLDHNDAEDVYTDTRRRLGGYTYDDSADDHHLYGTSSAESVASDLAFVTGTIAPAGKLYIGSTRDDGTLLFDGYVAEVIYWSDPLTPAALAQVYHYLRRKWDFYENAFEPRHLNFAQAEAPTCEFHVMFDQSVNKDSAGRIEVLGDFALSVNPSQGTVSKRPVQTRIGPSRSMGDFNKDFSDMHLLAGSALDLDVDDGSFSQFVVYLSERPLTVDGNTIFAKGINPLVGYSRFMAGYLADKSAWFVYGDPAGDVVETRDTDKDFGNYMVQINSATMDHRAGVDVLNTWSNGRASSFSGADASLVDDIDSNQSLFIGKMHQTDTLFSMYGKIGEIIFIKNLLDSHTKVQIENWLLDRWSGLVFPEGGSWVDPGLPDTLPATEGWWSSHSSADYTKSGSEVTVLADKSGNGRDFTPGGGTGPTIASFAGRDWLTYETSTPTVLRMTDDAINPGSGDFTIMVVYKTAIVTEQGLVSKMSVGDAEPDPQWGFRLGYPTNGDLSWQMRDTDNANLLSLEDTTLAWADDTIRVGYFSYNDSDEDAEFYGTHEHDGAVRQADAAYASVDIAPVNDMWLGAWDGGTNFEGEIGECIIFHAELTEAQRFDLYGYMRAKWGF